MELSIYIPNCHHGIGLEIFTAGKPFPEGHAIEPDTFVAMAKEAEEIGFDAIWVGDHIILPPRSSVAHENTGNAPGVAIRSHLPIFDPLPTLAFLAAHTKKVRLAIGVLIIPYRNPVLTAKWLASIDVLSGGRVLLGTGVGWLKDEFDAVDVPFETRGPMTDEYLELMRVLWTEEMPSFSGQFYDLAGDFHFEPKPVHGTIPIWVGGATGLALKRAARLGDGYFSAYATFEELEARYAKLTRLLEEQDRDPQDFVFAGQARWIITDEPYPDAPPCMGSPAKVADDIMRFKELGLDHLQIAPPPGPTREALLAQMRRFADDVAPRLDFWGP